MGTATVASGGDGTKTGFPLTPIFVSFPPERVQEERQVPADHADTRRWRILEREGTEGPEKETLRSLCSHVQRSLRYLRQSASICGQLRIPWRFASGFATFARFRGNSIQTPVHEPFTRRSEFSWSSPVKPGQTKLCSLCIARMARFCDFCAFLRQFNRSAFP